MATTKEIADIKARLDETEQEVKVIKENLISNTLALEENTILTKQIQANTQDIIDSFQTLKGGLKTAAWLGGAIKWIGGVLGGLVGAYLAVKAYLGQP